MELGAFMGKNLSQLLLKAGWLIILSPQIAQIAQIGEGKPQFFLLMMRKLKR